MDEIDALTQPRCPECGTVLRDSPPGFVCVSDGLLFIRDRV